MSESAPPKYVYKIVPARPPSPLPRELPLSELDAADGFVHLSTAQQVPGTLNLFFKSTASLYILRVPYDKIGAQTKWENTFPHLYGNFGADEVESFEEFKREDGEESWDKAVERQKAWLI
ncbi:uncharacterized protein B0I36DRAFT_329035 [Microdochium trichocladiopsis]|uniref:DUF952 domain-containing protein n=1 Tax=Microdochium trichocladiopsis TaxID=1682393 RepID=A0A9P8Y1A4_9PEZI|nr:uncharacterized protein B0I36DRAFT_329035 [Microdochium trichocladiopsis]KAH7025739.1 hypothetical protein B0I36DRAFT_329035 [Microdochium trichocladiopsis]